MQTPVTHRLTTAWIAVAFFALTVVPSLHARPGTGKDRYPYRPQCEVRLLFANDAIIDKWGGSDWGYTSGLRLFAMWPLDAEPVLPPSLPSTGVSIPSPRRGPAAEGGFFRPRMGVAAGQALYTPKDVDSTGVVEDDRPYAGWLYAGFLFEQKTDVGLLAAELDLGFTGAYSFAKVAQAYAHDVFNSPRPAGWHNQIATGVGANLQVTGAYQLFAVRASSAETNAARVVDSLVYGETALGNMLVAQTVGVFVRAGYFRKTTGNPLRHTSFAPEDRFPERPGPGQVQFAQAYLFFRLQSQFVAYNALIQGMPGLSNKHTADVNRLVHEAEAGVLVQPINLVDGAFSVTHRTQETKLGTVDRDGHTWAEVQVGVHFY